MSATDTSAKKQRGRPFARGQSGNPRGRPIGSRNAATLAAEALLDGETETLTRKAIELAKSGEMSALRLCLERILPPRTERPVAFHLPAIERTEDAPRAIGSIVAAIANGEVSIREASDISKIIENFVRALEATDLENRLRAIEERNK